MTDREIMQQALEALEEVADEVFSPYDNKLGETIIALRERLAQPEQEPWADQLEVERKKFKELNDVAALGMQHARADEREACAKVCESRQTPGTGSVAILNGAAENIRARGRA